MLKKNKKFFIFFILLTSNFINASIDDYIYKFNHVPSYSNYGTIGLIQMPSARMMPAGSLAISWSHSDPYLTGSVLAYPFNWFEASYQYTDINNALYSLTPSFSGDQTYKDKSFDAKFLLFKETNYLPAVAVGVRDMAGTGVFSSEYLVASKTISKGFRVSAGLGTGRLASEE